MIHKSEIDCRTADGAMERFAVLDIMSIKLTASGVWRYCSSFLRSTVQITGHHALAILNMHLSHSIQAKRAATSDWNNLFNFVSDVRFFNAQTGNVKCLIWYSSVMLLHRLALIGRSTQQ